MAKEEHGGAEREHERAMRRQGRAAREHERAEGEHIDETGVSGGSKATVPEPVAGQVLAWVRGYYICIY